MIREYKPGQRAAELEEAVFETTWRISTNGQVAGNGGAGSKPAIVILLFIFLNTLEREESK
jgi:hypothetical protein